MIWGVLTFVIVVQVIRLRARVADRLVSGGGLVTVDLSEAEQSAESMEDAGIEIDMPGLEVSGAVRTMMWTVAVIKWAPAAIALGVQWWIDPSPWITGAALGLYIVLNVITNARHTTARGHKPFGSDRTATEWLLLAVPLAMQVALIAWSFALAWTAIDGWGEDSMWRSIGLIVASIVVLAGCHLPVHLVDRWARRFRPPVFARDAPDSCVLFLRSFADDDVRLTAPLDIGLLGGPVLSLARPRFEELVAMTVAQQGPMVAIGRPGERLPEVGAGRTYWSDDDWQNAVITTAHRAERVIVVAGLSGGLAWEVDQLRSLGLMQKLLVLIPPGTREHTTRRVERALLDLGITEIEVSSLLARSLIAIGFDGDGSPRFVLDNRRSWFAYLCALLLHEIVLRGGEKRAPSEAGARPRFGGFSAGETARAMPPFRRAVQATVDGDHAAVISAATESLRYDRARSTLKVVALQMLADALRATGDRSEALVALGQLVELARADRDKGARAGVVYRFVDAKMTAAEAVLAALHDTVEVLGELGDIEGQVATLDLLASEALGRDSFERAEALREKARVALGAKDLDRALQFAEEAVADATDRNDVLDVGKAQLISAAVHEKLGDVEKARTALNSAESCFVKAGDDVWRSEVQRQRGIVEHRIGQRGNAVAYLGEAVSLARSSGNDFVAEHATSYLLRLANSSTWAGDDEVSRTAAEALAELGSAP